jgi:hypothetical protein
MPSVTDPASVVKRAAAALRTLTGCWMTRQVSRCLAELIIIDFPKLDPSEIVEALSIERVKGQLLTEALIDERARQIAVLEISRAHMEFINPDVEPAVTALIAVDEDGRALFVSQLGGAR